MKSKIMFKYSNISGYALRCFLLKFNYGAIRVVGTGLKSLLAVGVRDS